MKQQTKENRNIKTTKTKLGKLIQKLREQQGYSQRELARAVDLSPSNMKYIEDGVNAPSPEKYLSIIHSLLPNNKDRDKLDSLYSIIRGTPPPDICEFMCKNQELNDAIRIINGYELSPDQIAQVKQLFTSFKTEGEAKNG